MESFIFIFSVLKMCKDDGYNPDDDEEYQKNFTEALKKSGPKHKDYEENDRTVSPRVQTQISILTGGTENCSKIFLIPF